MIIELWTWKFSGKHKDNYTFWRNMLSDHIPKEGCRFIYTTNTGKEYHFRINHLEYAYKNGSLRAQLCIRKEGK